MAISSDRIKSWPALNLAILHHHHEAPFRLWLLLRALDTLGGCRVTEGDLREYIRKHRLFSDRRVRGLLSEGEALGFWVRRPQGRLYYAGNLKLAEIYGVRLDKDRPVFLDLATFRRIGAFRAALLATMFARKPQQFSQAELGKKTGRSRRSVIRYIQQMPDLQVQRNVVVTALDPNQPLTRELKACGHYKSTDGGRDVILKRTVNTYFQARAVRGAWGMSKHQGATPSEAAWGGTIHRVFLKTAHRLSKALSNLREGENLFCPRSTRLRFYRRRLWDRYTILDGVTVVG